MKEKFESDMREVSAFLGQVRGTEDVNESPFKTPYAAKESGEVEPDASDEELEPISINILDETQGQDTA
jgi:hypothetical protein